MKRYGNIYEKVYEKENISRAHICARRDKSFYREVKKVDSNPEYYLDQIQTLLAEKKYKVNDYTTKIINDKGKERVLMKLPYYPDRIIQWAIMLQIEHIFMETFTNFTCASIKNRGIHKASKLLNKYMKDKEGTQYCLKIDINKFYPSINKNILKSLLRRKFKDKDLLEILDQIIDSTESDIGIPIGSYLSQYLSNFYLSYFDHWLKEQCGVKYVIRYMDDVVILHSSKEYLHKLKKKMDFYLHSELQLKIKDNWQVFPTAVRGIDFVGYRHFYGYKLLRKSTCKRFKKKMVLLKQSIEKGIPIDYSDYCTVNSYKGWVKWCDGYRLGLKYIKPIQKDIDKYYLTQIKKKKVIK